MELVEVRNMGVGVGVASHLLERRGKQEEDLSTAERAVVVGVASRAGMWAVLVMLVAHAHGRLVEAAVAGPAVPSLGMERQVQRVRVWPVELVVVVAVVIRTALAEQVGRVVCQAAEAVEEEQERQLAAQAQLEVMARAG